MEPIIFAMGMATALCIVFLVYSVWISLKERDRGTEEPGHSTSGKPIQTVRSGGDSGNHPPQDEA